jgi:hypothetical protein
MGNVISPIAAGRQQGMREYFFHAWNFGIHPGILFPEIVYVSPKSRNFFT